MCVCVYALPVGTAGKTVFNTLIKYTSIAICVNAIDMNSKKGTDQSNIVCAQDTKSRL